MPKATGPFEVKLTPQTDSNSDPALSRMTLDKQFHGDLEATSQGQMLSAGSAQGCGVYVAIERVTGTLAGRRGSFVLHHTGIMQRSGPQLTIAVAPDSGTDQLSGLTGIMTIQIANGEHSYVFDYSLPS